MSLLFRLPLPLLVTLALGACAPSRPAPAVPELGPLTGVTADVREDVTAAHRALTRAPDDARAWAGLGRAFETHSLFARAVECFAGAHALEPQEPRHSHRAARNASRAGDLAGALSWAQETVALAPDYGPAWRLLGTWRLELGDLEGAREAFLRATGSANGERGGHAGLGRVALQRDDVAGALASLERALALDPSDPYVNLLYGNALRQAGRGDEAATYLARGVGATPRWVDPWSEEAEQSRRADWLGTDQAQAALEAGDYAAAAAGFARVLADRPGDAALVESLATAQSLAGLHAEALATIDAGLARSPGHHDLSVLRATSLRQAGRSAEAWAAVEDLGRTAPERADVWYLRGTLLQDRGDVTGAVEAFRESVRIEPADARGRMFLAAALLRSGRAQDAFDVLEQGLADAFARPPLTYFKLTISAAVQSGRTYALPQVLLRAREIHGDLAEPLERAVEQL